ncbi:MAG: DUF167 domain-containing protein [Patescibacteria group bacterium]|jgi:uncharacterized protein (TIGR00251 family)
MKLISYLKKLDQAGEVYLLCKIFPGSDSNKIKKTEEKEISGRFSEVIDINISAPADKNKANQELIKFLAKEFAVLKTNVIIISGKSDRLKLIKIIK